MPRGSPDFETFNGRADAGGGYANAPFDDGSALRSAAQVFVGLSDRLGRIADKAAATAGYAQAQAQADKAVGLPDVTFKLKPGKTDEAGTGRREPAAVMPAKTAAPAKALGSVAQRAAAARGYFEKQGYAPHQAAAIVGNLMQESTLRTAVVGDKSIPGGSVGIGQWNRERKAALHAFAQKQGKGWDDFETQLAFVHHELQTSEKAAGDRLRAAGNVDDATAAMIGYERPIGWTPQNPRGGHGWNNRLTYAKQVLGGASSGTMPAAIGGSVSAQAPFVPSTPEYSMRVNVPDPLPLALRRDGTITGEAHDRAIVETAGWKMQAGLDAELAAAFDNNRDDPAAFQKAIKEVADKYVKEAEAIGPDVSLKIKERAAGQLLTYGRDVASRSEQKAESERKSAAVAAVDEATKGVARQAYLIGTNEDGDARLSTLAAQAHHSVDAALESGAITPAQAAAQRENIATGLVTSRIQGVFDALTDPAAKQEFVKGLDEQYADPESPLAALSPDTFRRIRDALEVDARQGVEKAQASSALEKFTLKRALADDLASMNATGKGGKLGDVEIDVNEVARVLGPEDAANWLEQRGQARSLWEATSTMPVQTPEQIASTLQRLEPKAGEAGFERKQKTFELAAKEADRVLKLRREDPATAAEEAYPEIAKIEDLKQKAMKRMDAQGALGVAEKLRQPLTNGEARSLADRIEMVEDNPDALQPELQGMMGEMQKTFGPLADNVMVQVFEQRGIGKLTATTGLQLMKEMNLGVMSRQQDIDLYGMARKNDMADQAMKGATPKRTFSAGNAARGGGVGGKPANPNAKAAARAMAPNAAQVNMLKQNPDLAPQFDAKFGEGAAESLLKPRDEPVRRKLSDGSVELTYPDGWVELLKPDGTIDGRQGP